MRPLGEIPRFASERRVRTRVAPGAASAPAGSLPVPRPCWRSAGGHRVVAGGVAAETAFSVFAAASRCRAARASALCRLPVRASRRAEPGARGVTAEDRAPPAGFRRLLLPP